MSLEYGGLFDCGSKTVQPNTWQAQHNSHRIGKNADIGFTGINPSNQCVPLISSENTRELIKVFIRYTAKYITEGDHYHITVN
jgi:hypothetical protein